MLEKYYAKIEQEIATIRDKTREKRQHRKIGRTEFRKSERYCFLYPISL